MTLHLEVNNLLCQFFRAFDDKDWNLMVDCLAPDIHVDYSSSGREQPGVMTGLEFVKRREAAVDVLAKHHSFSNLLLTESHEDEAVAARCNYLILRFKQDTALKVEGDDFFHSCGSYEFIIKRALGNWRIASIKQQALRSWGNSKLHGGTRQ